jgi:hypothetical protein
MRWILTKIRTSLAIRGNLGTLKLCGEKAISLYRGLLPSYQAVRNRARERDQEFDRKYGVETSCIFHPTESAVRGNNWIYGVRYQSTDPIWFRRVIKELSLPYEEFVFIDYGSGKGRALLLAAGFRFKRVVGIEYCEDLNTIAQQNLLRYPDASKLCKDIDLVCMDATEYRLPNEPLVLFFYNPFGRPVMEKVVKNVVDSFELNPRRMIIIYLTPEYADLWDKVWFLKRSRPGHAIWDTGSTLPRT